MSLTIRKGTISNMSEGVNIIGRNGNMMSQHTSSFRIENLPARLKSGNHNSYSNGDRVTAVGKIKNGTLVVYAIKNETTGAHDEAQITIPIILGVCMLVLGIPLSFFIIGLPLLVFGIITLYGAFIGYQAKNLLHAN